MSIQQQSFLKRAFTAQWSFFWAGIAFGVAQIIYMLGLALPKIMDGKSTGWTLRVAVQQKTSSPS